MKVLVVGASRGIGLALVRHYRAAHADVTATARDEAGLARLRGLGATAWSLDVADGECGARLSTQTVGAAYDVAIVNAGVYGPRTQGLQPPSADDFDAVMHTNVLGPMRVIPALADRLAVGARLAVISSRMGSIGTRSGTAGWLYRASKAAVNSVLKDASLVLNGRAVCVALHPGYVQTDMNAGSGELTADQSASDLARTIAGLRTQDNGGYFDHDGSPIAW